MKGYSKLVRFALIFLGLLLPLSRMLALQPVLFSHNFGYADKEAEMVSMGPGRTAFISAAIKLPKMPGNEILELTFFVSGTQEQLGDQHSIFIASASDNQVKYIQSARFVPGWNKVELTNRFTMQDDVYYVGYQLQARVGQNPLALEAPSSGKLDGVDFIEIGGVYQEVGDVVDFAPISDARLGNLQIFAHVGELKHRLVNVGSLVSGKFEAEELTGNTEHNLTLKVRNLGRSSINTLDVSTQFGVEGERVIRITGLDIPGGATRDVSLRVTAPRRGLGSFYAAVVKINDEANLFADTKCVVPYKVKTANASSPRKTILVERFTTERCVNCPASEPLFRSLVSQMESEGMEVSVVAHHAGYYTDDFTLPESSSLVPYSYASGEFAPALMVNRLPDSQYGPGYLAGLYANRADKYARAKAVGEELFFTNVRATEQAGGRLNVQIEGEVGQVDQASLLLTAVITEDHVRAINQAGANGVFYHHHLARKFLTSAFGTPIELKPDGTFSLELRGVSVDPLWKKENLRVVIFAHKNLRAADYTQREVYASKTVRWSALTALEEIAEAAPQVFVRDGYLIVDADAATALEVYDMAGHLVTRSASTRLEKGIYVVRLGSRSKYTAHKVVVD